jgi:hypothetical protein
MVHRLLYVISIFIFKFYFSFLSAVANIIGAACNSQIPQANLYACICTCKKLKPLKYLYLKRLLVRTKAVSEPTNRQIESVNR